MAAVALAMAPSEPLDTFGDLRGTVGDRRRPSGATDELSAADIGSEIRFLPRRETSFGAISIV